MELELYLMEVKDNNEQAVESYKTNLSKISTGRANPAILNSVNVMYYEALTPIAQLAAISVPEPRQLLIKPFDQTINKDIVSSINSASLGLNAVDEGHQARITIPDLTTERRRELVKSLANYTEQAKIKIRQSRHDANKLVKADEDLSEDNEKNYLAEIQKVTDEYVAKVTEITKAKENDLMSM